MRMRNELTDEMEHIRLALGVSPPYGEIRLRAHTRFSSSVLALLGGEIKHTLLFPVTPPSTRSPGE